MFSVNGTYARLSKILYGTDGKWYASQIKGVPVINQIDSTINLSAEISDNIYKLFINDTPIMSIKIEDNTFHAGHCGIFSYSGNYCKKFTISTEIPSVWRFDTPSDGYIGAVGDER
jgi:hypothetical protein